MKILICNERFLFRFGVDRVLMILGKYFKEMGHEIVMIGNKLDSQAVSSCTDDFILLPEAPEYVNSNDFALDWLKSNWGEYFNSSNKPDIAIIAGWPFYTSFEFLKEKCGHVIFHDYGAVPTENISGGNLVIQSKLRQLRSDNISKADKIIAISKFLEDTQSKKDALGLTPTSKILLGVDHMELGIWKQEDLKTDNSNIVENANNLHEQGYKLIFLLGRWEDSNYKNSAASFELIKILKRKSGEKIRIFVLAKDGDITIPNDLKEEFVHLGYVDDFTLQKLMSICDVGISVSLWEGFNLPLGEMQVLDKPVYVYNVGAHPEVVIHPYYLCNDLNDMVEKVYLELIGMSKLEKSEITESAKKFKNYFTWERSAREFIDSLTSVLYKNYIVLIDVTNACHDTANSGVMRVTRHIAKNLQDRVNTVFLLWDSSLNRYVLPYNEEVKLLCAYGGPDSNRINLRSKQGNNRLTFDEIFINFKNNTLIMLITETINEEAAAIIRPYLRGKKIKTSAIFYDAIPVLLPEYCSNEVVKNHVNYMRGLSECDVVIPIAETNKNDLLKFWLDNNIGRTTVISNLLPGELQGIRRVYNVSKKKSNKIKMLMVSTLEPRKNHKRLLNACIMLEQKYPEIDWDLTLVGNRYVGNDEIPNYVEKICKENNRIKWLGVVDDQKLFKLYSECTYTIYPSIIEGFGMPIMESLWNGKVCICSNDGVMSELAKDGGCYTVDVKNEQEICNALYTLASDTSLREKLEREAVARHIMTWDDYTIRLLDIIYNVTHSNESTNFLSRSQLMYSIDFAKESYLFNNEMLALMGLLNNLKPEYSIICGDLPLEFIQIVNKQSKVTFLNNNDLHLGEITQLMGNSTEIMPILFDELMKNNVQPDFLLLSGEEFDKNQLVWLQDLKSINGLFFIITDSFKRQYRESLKNFNWRSIENLRWISYDFIQGRLIQEECCGGLACGYISSIEKQKDLIIEKQAEDLYKILSNVK